MISKAKQLEIDNARAALRAILKPGMTVHTILRHVSRSGMMRVIDLVIIGKKGETRHIGRLVAKATDRTWDNDRDGIKIGGCGMDMGFAIVYALSYVLYPDGFRLRKGMWHNNLKPGMKCRDGGYAINQRWL